MGEDTGILPHVTASRVPITGLLFISVVLALISGRAVWYTAQQGLGRGSRHFWITVLVGSQ